MPSKINISAPGIKFIVYIALTFITLSVFWQTNQFDFFLVDDSLYVTQNNHIQSGITLKGIRWAFSTIHAEYYIPLTWLSFMVDYQIYGLHAGGYHLTNLILHLMSALLLFWLFNRMTGAVWRSAFVAFLFALHPLHVEPVAWITCRNTLLSAFFCILTLCLYVYYTEKPAARRYLPVLFCFACALMSKPVFMTLPVVMMLLDYWPLGRFDLKKESFIFWQMKEKIPFFVLSAIFTVITIVLRLNRPHTSFPLEDRLSNALVSFVTYLEKTLWPHDLAFFYPFPSHFPEWQVIGAAFLIIFISSFVMVMMKRLPHLFVGWFWFLIIVFPVLGIIQDNDQAMADRFHYLPSIGIGMMMAWGLPVLFFHPTTRKNILLPAGIVAIVMMTLFTWHQCTYWTNDIELFKRTLNVTNNNYVMHNLMGVALEKDGKTKEALQHFNDAIRLKPDYMLALINRGTAYYKLGSYQQAIDDYNQVIRLKPDYADAYNNRGLAYGKLGQYQQAIADFNEAIRLKPNYAGAFNNRGLAYLLQGQKELGCREAKKACELGMCKLLEFTYNKGYCH
ncbi:MAG TPA: tetratricopeptide repeat protein [Smithella sp.]|nr:tetratricopeptide repeat protein [Smithella sp.]